MKCRHHFVLTETYGDWKCIYCGEIKHISTEQEKYKPGKGFSNHKFHTFDETMYNRGVGVRRSFNGGSISDN